MSKTKTPKNTEPSLFLREVWALLALGLGTFFYLSLFSYHPLDPSLHGITSPHLVHNWGGVVGAYLSDSFLFLFGGGAYVAGLFFFALAFSFFAGTRHRVRFYDVLLYGSFVIFVAVLCQMQREFFYFSDEKLAAGGMVGGILARLGNAYLGRPGTYLLVVCGALLTFIGVTRFSLREIFFQASRGFLWLATHLGQWARIYSARLQKTTKALFDSLKQKLSKPKEPEVKLQVPPVFTKKITAPEVPLLPKPLAQEISVPEVMALPGEPVVFDRVDKKKPVKTSRQLSLQSLAEGYELPPLNLLDSEEREAVPVDEESLKMNARLLEKKLLDFSVEGQVTEIHPGPVITMYEFQPAPGVKLSRIANLVDDLGLAMGGRSVRIVAPLPDKAAVGIEIPNNVRETVWLKDIIADARFQKGESKLPMALGKDIAGHPVVADLAKMPHLLVAGATGSGKSVSVNSMIVSLLYKYSPQEVRIIMVDPKMLELSIYEGIPHLLLPVVTEPKKASLALRWAVREMEKRYRLMSDINARNILNYNQKLVKGDFVSKAAERQGAVDTLSDEDAIRHDGALPYLVIIIDELADLMMVSSREVEESITRLAQMARAAGIHLILATQRPSVDVITGIIKANFPARISFKVSSKHDSRTILDRIGAEYLLGAGDMLYVPPGASRLMRLHGAYITESEVGRIVEFLKKQAQPIYDESILKPIETDTPAAEAEEEADDLYDQAVAIVAETKQASISMVQRRLRVGYNRAARMIERMEHEGIVSPPSSGGQRQVLVSAFQPAS